MMNRTNWLHRVDALRVHDIREMNILWEVAEICLEHCNQFVLWSYVIQNVILNAYDTIYQQHLKKVLDLIMGILQLLCSEGYCYYLDYMRIAFSLQQIVQMSSLHISIQRSLTYLILALLLPVI